MFDNTNMDILERVVSNILPYSLKDQQIEAIQILLEGQHAFLTLPTGYGKSDVFMLQPLIMDEVTMIAYCT